MINIIKHGYFYLYLSLTKKKYLITGFSMTKTLGLITKCSVTLSFGTPVFAKHKFDDPMSLYNTWVNKTTVLQKIQLIQLCEDDPTIWLVGRLVSLTPLLSTANGSTLSSVIIALCYGRLALLMVNPITAYDYMPQNIAEQPWDSAGKPWPTIGNGTMNNVYYPLMGLTSSAAQLIEACGVAMSSKLSLAQLFQIVLKLVLQRVLLGYSKDKNAKDIEQSAYSQYNIADYIDSEYRIGKYLQDKNIMQQQKLSENKKDYTYNKFIVDLSRLFLYYLKSYSIFLALQKVILGGFRFLTLIPPSTALYTSYKLNSRMHIVPDYPRTGVDLILLSPGDISAITFKQDSMDDLLIPDIYYMSVGKCAQFGLPGSAVDGLNFDNCGKYSTSNSSKYKKVKFTSAPVWITLLLSVIKLDVNGKPKLLRIDQNMLDYWTKIMYYMRYYSTKQARILLMPTNMMLNIDGSLGCPVNIQLWSIADTNITQLWRNIPTLHGMLHSVTYRYLSSADMNSASKLSVSVLVNGIVAEQSDLADLYLKLTDNKLYLRITSK